MFTFNNAFISTFFGLLLLLLNACTPEYPKCKTDDHCAEKGEYCVAEFCQKCRSNDHCKVAGQVCGSSNTCQYKTGYCDDKQACPGNQKCRNNECGPECIAGKSECSASQYCDENSGTCITKPQCGSRADREKCENGFDCISGTCRQKVTTCELSEPVYFKFDSDRLLKKEQSKLDTVANCLKGDSVAAIQVAGNADQEGSEDHNLALGEKRAQAVYDYLLRVGVPSSLMRTISYGENKPAIDSPGRQAKNRRVEFEAP
jgi:peptidoglycan-associated lipoprotein